MKFEKRHFEVVLPGDIRVFKDLEIRDERPARIQDEVRQMVQQVVYAAKLTTPRKNPVDIKVKVFEQTIKDGKIVETPCGSLDITPPLEPMTRQEYDEEIRGILADLPASFHSFVSHQLSERDVSYEESVGIARELVDGLRPAIAAYAELVIKAKR